MNVEFLILGQGICGTFLSYYLQKENRSFLVIDNDGENSPSKIAAGIINPVTGRRMVTTWMIEELQPFAWHAYTEIGHAMDITAISQKSIIDFFPTPQMLEAFTKRIEEGAHYLHAYPEQNHFNPFFNYDFGCGEIRPVYTAHTEMLLPAWRRFLKNEKSLLEENFEPSELIIKGDQIHYKGIAADKIIFCDGAHGFENPYFKLLPFAPNKGEALIVEIPDLPDHHIYKKGMLLTPFQRKDVFWIGSSYEWNFTDSAPTKKFRDTTERLLKEWLKVPFRILEHKAGIRPATLERRPFVGVHPFHKNIGILNGMGTKGCSLAPYFAKQLVSNLLHQVPLQTDADINRFHKILARKC
ncbi:MAG: FAD-dependent oxidoreductase [Chitinophagaceae bacterium]|nr:FAD-dependent oxidoreductase [Chitinophagaceae bacterium]